MTPLFLIGFPTAGKTSVGREVAARTGRRFVDLDDAIAQAGGEPVPALVARDEAEFRRREAAALAGLVGERDVVISTGGGAPTFGDNLARMMAAGLVVALGVDVAEAERRAALPGEALRPLLASVEPGPSYSNAVLGGAATALAAKRAPIYRRAHAVIDTTGRALADVASEVIAVERTWRARPSLAGATLVALGDRSYGVVVEDALPAAAIREHAAGATKIAVITDRNVARHHLAGVLGVLGGTARVESITLEPGEQSKAFAVYQQLVEDLIRRGFDRGSLVVALGGGVVGDLAGFVAATTLRGLPIIQIPTTIVAMTDAAIGGKTAIDLPAGKNLVGAFHQPRLVACDLSALTTLPARERRAGFGELWKYALLDGADLWAAVAACAPWAAGPEATPPPPELAAVVRRAVAYKAAIVARDEREVTGYRALLNLGHTVGHAIESATGMLHGEAVALGLVAACRVSAALDPSPHRRALESDLVESLTATGLDAAVDPYLTDDILARIAVDKKRVGAKVGFIVVRDLGVCERHDLSVADIQRILRRVPGA